MGLSPVASPKFISSRDLKCLVAFGKMNYANAKEIESESRRWKEIKKAVLHCHIDK